MRRQVEPLLVGRTVTAAWGKPLRQFESAVEATGAGIEDVRRRGKYLVLGLDDGREMVLHLGMTGWLRPRPDGDIDPYVRAWWALDDGQVLELRDVRQFGRVAVVPAGDYESLPTLAALGPEPWDPALDDDGLWRRLRGHRARIKTQLLSQRPIAGIGNIYADEGLWHAGVHPTRRSISRPQATRLLAGLRAALELALANDGTTFRDYRTVGGEPGRNSSSLSVYGRGGEPCLRCGTELRRVVYDGRTATFCPVCQRRR